MPFAMASVALASSKHAITSRALLWILVAMIGARTAAMGFNRLADRQFDALNPRTRMWELPRGLVGVWEAAALTVAAALIFVLSAYQLNWTCFLLSPVALAIAFFYSLTKRFTWASHLFLGLALAIAPIGAWLAVADAPITLEELSVPVYLGLAVVFWLAGFDIICKTTTSTAPTDCIQFQCVLALPGHCGFQVCVISLQRSFSARLESPPAWVRFTGSVLAASRQCSSGNTASSSPAIFLGSTRRSSTSTPTSASAISLPRLAMSCLPPPRDLNAGAHFAPARTEAWVWLNCWNRNYQWVGGVNYHRRHRFRA
jgi:hypothetical protein